jgi:hypothetical protein
VVAPAAGLEFKRTVEATVVDESTGKTTAAAGGRGEKAKRAGAVAPVVAPDAGLEFKRLVEATVVDDSTGKTTAAADGGRGEAAKRAGVVTPVAAPAAGLEFKRLVEAKVVDDSTGKTTVTAGDRGEEVPGAPAVLPVVVTSAEVSVGEPGLVVAVGGAPAEKAMADGGGGEGGNGGGRGNGGDGVLEGGRAPLRDPSAATVARNALKRYRNGRGAPVRGWWRCGGRAPPSGSSRGSRGLLGRGVFPRGVRKSDGLWKCVVRERAVSLRSRGATFRGVRICGGGGGRRVGGGFSRKLMARVETQAQLAFRCDHGCGDAQGLSELNCPFGAFVIPFSCFSSELRIALRFLRRGRLRKVFTRSRSGRGATIHAWQQWAVRERAFEVRRGGGATGSVDEALRRREREKRALPAARDIIDQEGPQTCFNPFVMSSSGGFGPAARAFLKTLYATARRTGHWVMASGQPQIDVTWITLFASDYWNMRLSMACTVTSAEVVGKLLVRDFSKDLVTHPERRQAPRDPNFSAVGWESLAVGWDGGSAV